MTITGKTKVLTLFGSPVTHSLSPQMHAGWIADHKLDAVYVALPLDGKDIDDTMEALRRVGFHGANITVPYKDAAAKAADWQDEAVIDLGAANVLRWENGELYAGNTDAPGFIAALDEQAPEWKGAVERALVIGAGGAAKAIAYGLAKAGVAHIDIVNRSRPRAVETADAISAHAPSVAARPWYELEAAINAADLIVNATTLGMVGKDRHAWKLDGAKETAIVADAVYAPLETDLLRAAKLRGLRTVDGLAMLIHQGVLSFQRWFEIMPDAALARERLMAVIGSRMKLVGLTGSIGMGKSATAQMFRDEGVRVYDADAAVHAIYDVGGSAVGPVGELFPDAIVDGAVDRTLLSKAVLNDAEALKKLEAIVHPLVAMEQQKFMAEARAAGADLIVLDIPLLFEKGGEKRVDAVVVVSAPAGLQRERVLARPGMSEEKFEAILSKQTPDAEKREKAHHVIETGGGFEEARAQVRAVLDALRKS